jgi:hypothetical protein
MHLSHHDIKTCTPVCKKSGSSVCSQWQLASRPRRLQNVYQPDASSESQRNIKTRRHVGTVGKMALTSGWHYEPHDFHLGTWLVSNLQHTPTRTKLSRPRCCPDTRRQLFLLRLDTSLPAAVRQVLDVSGGYMEVRCLPSKACVQCICSSQN